MNSKEVAAFCGCTPQNIRKKTKQSLERGENVLHVKGVKFVFEVVNDKRGKAYEYKEIENLKGDENVCENNNRHGQRRDESDRGGQCGDEMWECGGGGVSEKSGGVWNKFAKETKVRSDGGYAEGFGGYREVGVDVTCGHTRLDNNLRNFDNNSDDKEDVINENVNTNSQEAKLAEQSKCGKRSGFGVEYVRAGEGDKEHKRGVCVDGHENAGGKGDVRNSGAFGVFSQRGDSVDGNRDKRGDCECIFLEGTEGWSVHDGDGWRTNKNDRGGDECVRNECGRDTGFLQERTKKKYTLQSKLSNKQHNFETKGNEAKRINDENTSGWTEIDSSTKTGVEDSSSVEQEISIRGDGTCKVRTARTVGDGFESSKGCKNESEEAFAKLDMSQQSEEKMATALEKRRVVEEWNKQKGNLKIAAFLEWINMENICSQKVTQNKLFAWQRALKKGGFEALIDRRTSNRKPLLKELGLEEYVQKLIYAQKGGVNISNIHELCNQKAIIDGKLSIREYLSKKDEIVSYKVIYKHVKKYLKENKLLRSLILYGEDVAIGSHLSALGVSNWATTSINQVVEIDATPFDAMCNLDELSDNVYEKVKGKFLNKEEFSTKLKEWHERYTIISLIDTYSGVGVYHLCEGENSINIARAVAKYIRKLGVPKQIKGDNGKAFLSKYTKGVLEKLNIEYKAVRAYSGWLKPYVENGFRKLQNRFTQNLAGYIGHNITQRQAIEFFFSKKERRLKKNQKTNLKQLQSMEYMSELMEMYVDKIMHNTYLPRLEMSPRECYELKQNEATWMDEININMALGERMQRTVQKGKISLDGIYFYNVSLSSYDKVYASRDLDDINRCFVWNAKGKFVGVGTTLDLVEGVSVEEAKMSQKILTKRIKEEKGKMSKARDEATVMYERFVRETQIETIQSKTPLIPEAINLELQKAKNLKVSGGLDDELLDMAELRRQKAKRPMRFEDIVLKDR